MKLRNPHRTQRPAKKAPQLRSPRIRLELLEDRTLLDAGQWLVYMHGLGDTYVDIQMAAFQKLLAQSGMDGSNPNEIVVKPIQHMGVDGVILVQTDLGVNAKLLQAQLTQLPGFDVVEDFNADDPVDSRHHYVDLGPAFEHDGGGGGGDTSAPPPGGGGSGGAGGGPLVGGPPSIVNPVNGFDGIGSPNSHCGCSPPDSDGAVGPSVYIHHANTAIALYDKATGNLLPGTSITADATFYASILRSGDSFSDPVTFYDEYTGKFVTTELEFNGGANMFLDVATSRTSNPTTLTSADWTFAQYNTGEGFGSISDYPKAGYNADGYVFSFNMFNPGFTHATVLAIRNDGTSPGMLDVPGGFSNFTLAPASMHGGVPSGSPMWFVQDGHGSGGGSTIQVVSMVNPFSSTPSFASVNLTVPSYGSAPNPRQPGGSLGSRTSLGTRFYFSSLRTIGGVMHLVAADAVGVSRVGGSAEQVRWYDINLSTPTPTIFQQGSVNPNPDHTDTYFPDAEINADGTIGMIYQQSGDATSGEFMSVYVTGRNSGDAPGTMETGVRVKTSTVNLNAFGRAGDYGKVTIDPTDGTFWGIDEYAAGSSPNWAEWIEHFRIGTPAGPFINAQTPSGTAFPPVTTMQVTFSEPVLTSGPHGFDPSKITSLSGPAPFTIASVTPVSPVGGFASTFTITFGGAGLTTAGAYSFHIGPDIEDAAGNMMDQNQNGTPGEPTDFYLASITIGSPAVLSATPTGTVAPVQSHVHLHFNEAVQVSTILPSITAFTRNGVSILGDIASISPSSGTATDVDINFSSGLEKATGVYSMTIGTGVTDAFGNHMAAPFVETFNIDGPIVTGITPTGSVLGPISSETVTFSRAMDATTISGQVTVVGPGGPVGFTISPTTGTSTTFTITFTSPLTAFGTYTTTVGPNVKDTFGNSMDQNGNFIPGESGVAPAGDQFRSTFTIINPAAVGPDGFGYIANQVPPVPFVELLGDPSAFTVINFADDLSVPVDLGSNKFNFYGKFYTGNNQLFVSSNGMISFGSADSRFSNTDLTDSSEPLIAPLWADWIKSSGTPMVLGKFDAVNNKLIIEWNQVSQFSFGGSYTFEAILSLNTTGTNTAPFSVVYKSFSANLPFRHTVGSKDSGPQPPDLSGYKLLVEYNTRTVYVQPGISLTWTAPPFGGTITGTVYNDLNHNGVRDTGEPALAGWTVYEDLNNNGQFDPGEPFGISDASGNYTITNAFPGSFVVREVLQPNWVRSQPSGAVTTSTLDDFETGPSDLTHYTFTGTNGATVTAAAAHDGAFGLRLGSFTDWMYRNDAAAHVAQGDTISVWVRQGDLGGRAYFGFGASSGGTLSVVMAPNTGTFIIQNNSGYGFTDLVSAPQTWAANHWYRMQVTWGTGGLITARLFDSDGTTLLNTISTTTTVITSGGNTDFDTAVKTGASLDDGYAITLAPRGTVGGNVFGNYTVTPNPIVDNQDFSYEEVGSGWTTLPGGYNGNYRSHASAVGGNLVTNPGFETGDFTGWTVNDPSGGTVVDNFYIAPHSGTWVAYFGAVGGDGTISQTVATVPGHHYTFSFWLASDGATPNDFSASFGGATVFSVTNDPSHDYVLHTFDVVATGTSTVIQFAGRNDPGFLALDDVSVADATPPEIATANWFVAPPGGPGSYELYATWVAAPGNATNVRYNVYDGATLLTTVTVNQQRAANQALVGGVYWLRLGTFTTTTGVFVISIDNTTANGNISADAVFAAPAPSLVINGGFETGDFTGWTVNDPTDFTFVDTGNAHSGNFSAYFSAIGTDGTISQTIVTVPGRHYTFSFWLYSDGATPNHFSASFGGTTVFSVTNDPAHGYVQHTFDVVATGTSTVIRFAGRNDQGFLQLDDVSLFGPFTAEPATASGLVAAPGDSGGSDDLNGEGLGATSDGSGSLRQASLVLGGGQAGNGAAKAVDAPAAPLTSPMNGPSVLDQAFSGSKPGDYSGFLAWNGSVLRRNPLGRFVGDPLTGQMVDSLLDELVPTV